VTTSWLAERFSHAQTRKCIGTLSLTFNNLKYSIIGDFMAFEEVIDEL
jgi:hypothetical protein